MNTIIKNMFKITVPVIILLFIVDFFTKNRGLPINNNELESYIDNV